MAEFCFAGEVAFFGYGDEEPDLPNVYFVWFSWKVVDAGGGQAVTEGCGPTVKGEGG